MSNTGSNLYAVLIGAGGYLPHELPGGWFYPSLEGCVRDVEGIERFLLERLGVCPKRIRILKSSSFKEGSEPPEPPEEWPTRRNILTAIEETTTKAQSGDQVYIHYSGHGGRVPTILPHLKGDKALDEALIPIDIGRPDANYIRDVQIAELLQTLIEKGLFVTLILDSCYSAGAIRGRGDIAVRSVNRVDTTPRSEQEDSELIEELTRVWKRWTGAQTRDQHTVSGWLPHPKDYVLLAACRSVEAAHEYAYDGEEGRHGVLTYWLLDTLKQWTPNMTYRALHNRLLAKVHSQFESQTPVLEGEEDRTVFGGISRPITHAVNVLKVDSSNERILLQTGQAQGVTRKARFGIFSGGVASGQKGNRKAIAEIDEIGSVQSWAKVVRHSGSVSIEEGDQAVLQELGSLRLLRSVGLVRSPGKESALDSVAKVLKERAAGFLSIDERTGALDFQVAVSNDGRYEVWDGAGVRIPNLNPALSIGDPDAAGKLVDRLLHLACYRNILQLDNHDSQSPLSGAIELEIGRLPRAYDPSQRPRPKIFRDLGNTVTTGVGDWICVQLINRSRQTLNLVVLDLQPAWGIEQLYPSKTGGAFATLEPGQEQLLPLKAFLPDGYEEGTDQIKVVAAVGAIDYRWLQLPPLDQPLNRGVLRSPGNALEELFSALGAPRYRNFVEPGRFASHEWTVSQIEVKIVRSGRGGERGGV